ncbi:MAG: hypothetical protein HDR25_08370 [Lachnospiraceae bacterium]|nr:hypothetical protein [Lachnospiraceae bacterium]
MENIKMENKFAKELATDLEGMGFQEGIDMIQEVFEWDDILCNASELCSAHGYKYRNECEVIANGFKEKGIDSIYFKLNINPTYEEMVCLLEEYGEYDEDEELDEDEIYIAFSELIDSECFCLNYDEIVYRFDDVQTFWDVLIDEECHYYRGSDGIVYKYIIWAFPNEE